MLSSDALVEVWPREDGRRHCIGTQVADSERAQSLWFLLSSPPDPQPVDSRKGLSRRLVMVGLRRKIPVRLELLTFADDQVLSPE